MFIIIGASGHGKVIADIAKACGYGDIVFLDDNDKISSCARYPVLGTTSLLETTTSCLMQDKHIRDNRIVANTELFRPEKIDHLLFIAIGSATVRQRLMERYKSYKFPVLIHPKAVVACDVKIGAGSVVMAGAVINTGTTIGCGCIVNTSSSIDHDCKLGNFVHVSVGAHLAGTVNVGNQTWIGAGAIISNNLNICGGCTVGAGAVVIRDIKNKGTYIGVPAKMMNKRNVTPHQKRVSISHYQKSFLYQIRQIHHKHHTQWCKTMCAA